MSQRLTQDEVIESFKKIHGDRYDYSRVEYVNGDTRVTIGCKRCGRWFPQKPLAHKQGQGCKKCAMAAIDYSGLRKGKPHANLVQSTGFVWYDLLIGVVRLAQLDIEASYDPLKDRTMSKTDAASILAADDFMKSIHHIIDIATPSTIINGRGYEVTQ